jgi:hypothetical protein
MNVLFIHLEIYPGQISAEQKRPCGGDFLSFKVEPLVLGEINEKSWSRIEP